MRPRETMRKGVPRRRTRDEATDRARRRRLTRGRDEFRLLSPRGIPKKCARRHFSARRSRSHPRFSPAFARTGTLNAFTMSIAVPTGAETTTAPKEYKSGAMNETDGDGNRDRKVAFITGVTGQDGSYLVELLLSKGAYVVCSSSRARAEGAARGRGARRKSDDCAELCEEARGCFPDYNVRLIGITDARATHARRACCVRIVNQCILSRLCPGSCVFTRYRASTVSERNLARVPSRRWITPRLTLDAIVLISPFIQGTWCTASSDDHRRTITRVWSTSWSLGTRTARTFSCTMAT